MPTETRLEDDWDAGYRSAMKQEDLMEKTFNEIEGRFKEIYLELTALWDEMNKRYPAPEGQTWTLGREGNLVLSPLGNPVGGET